jgi:hypothetical protein
MEEIEPFNKIKLDQLRSDILAGIASGDAGTLDIEEIKQRGRARLKDALSGTKRRNDVPRSCATSKRSSSKSTRDD